MDKELSDTIRTKNRIGRSVLTALPMFFLTFFFLSGGKPDFSDTAKTLAFLITFLFLNGCFFLMLYKGKTDRYRAIIFILFALFLSFTFIRNMVDIRQSVSFSRADMVECNIPFCHLVIPMMIIPAALTKSIIFPGSIINGFANISMMMVLWMGATLALGRGFCSWGCFYGGWDDGFSRIRKKPAIKRIGDQWKWMPFAVLLLVMISAALTLIPTYCDWICPFKTVTEYEKVTSVESLAKTVVFAGLFLGLVVVLPVLTKKRTQCSFLCPLGALNSLSNAINVFVVRVRKDRCTECGKCVSVCPVFAMNIDDIRAGKISTFCVKCGKCIDACTKEALHFGIRGVEAGKLVNFSRNLFLYTSFLFLAVFSGGTIQYGLQLILRHIV